MIDLTRKFPIRGSRLVGPGALKEKQRLRAWPCAQPAQGTRRYVELHASSAFSFLNGSSLPEDLVARAAALDLSAVALVDQNGLYGAPRFYKAAKAAGIRALVGAEVVLGKPAGSRLTLLVNSRKGYSNLCRLLTCAASGRPKGQALANWEMIATHAEGLECLTGGSEGPLTAILREQSIEEARLFLERLRSTFPTRLYVELQRHHLRDEEHVNAAAVDLARRFRLPLLATNGVRYARQEDKDLHDVLTCVRGKTDLDRAGSRLAMQRERHLKSASEMAVLFSDLPGAVEGSVELSERMDFTLGNLGYKFPSFPLPPGETPFSYLRTVTWAGARSRLRPLTARAQAQINKELTMIEKLGLAGYFLVVWDIVRFCQKQKILVQGRGSAANSAVCYALSITAIDPVKMNLLFERFLSEERGEWPDIDLDLPSGDARERVIQYVYERYGARGAAMTASVVTYRDRSAAREVGKALGFSPDGVDRLSKRLSGYRFGEAREDLAACVASAGFDPANGRVRHFMRLFESIQNLPRHLGQHSGGMVIAQGTLDEVVPLEPASMPGRVVAQWDKDDCADLGIIKVDLLGLGMLAALEEALPMIRSYEGCDINLAHLPQDDPEVYRMLNVADTVGVFQVESRAQMATLPRNAPRVFYDLVIQVAIIRPGPIVGGMVKPFFDRRCGKAPVEYPHPSLEPILARTLGVPLFQEQLLRIAMTAAGFSGGEAEELRQAMGFKRSVERMTAIEKRLRDGMTERGINGKAQEEIVRSITAFALYGFPESHAASFALLAYASAYMKAHHPTAFTVALLNAWPMGFYHPATIVKDAQRHGVEVRPIDVTRSGWKCRWEERSVRLGLRFVKGLSHATGLSIEQEAARGPFADVDNLVRRCHIAKKDLSLLAYAGALAGFGMTRRAALWQSARIGASDEPLFPGRRKEGPSPLPEMSMLDETIADYDAADLTAGPHLMQFVRKRLNAKGVVPVADLVKVPDKRRVRTAGVVIVRQRPETANGFMFLSIEDETGISQAIVSPALLDRQREKILGSAAVVVEGVLQKTGGTLSVRAERIWSVKEITGQRSRDFR